MSGFPARLDGERALDIARRIVDDEAVAAAA
jgi:hypothetical protein